MRDHLTFNKQVEQGTKEPMPCICWYAGYNGTLDITDVIHPVEYTDGDIAKYGLPFKSV